VAPTGGYSTVDNKRVIVHTPEEWARIVESARTGKNFAMAKAVGVSPELGRPEGAL